MRSELFRGVLILRRQNARVTMAFRTTVLLALAGSASGFFGRSTGPAVNNAPLGASTRTSHACQPERSSGAPSAAACSWTLRGGFAATVALFAVAGIITIVMATRSLDRLSTIISETGTGLRTAEKAQHAAQIAILKADQAAEQSEIKINNARELNAKQKEIGEREAALRGFYRGALRIIASQLESILSPMAPDDRDFFVLNDEVYLTVMKGAKSVKFFPATDPENLKEVAENEGLSPVRTDQLASAIQENADAEAPYMAFDSADDAIRIIANIGPTEDRFGVLEVTLEDQLTPMKKEAGNLALDFMMRLGAQTKEQEKNFETIWKMRLAEGSGFFSSTTLLTQISTLNGFNHSAMPEPRLRPTTLRSDIAIPTKAIFATIARIVLLMVRLLSV